jgi:Spy/CpxP family protein refolding chaperone
MGPVMDDEAKMRAARHKMREQMRANRQAYNAELKKILTDEQFQQYEADQTQRREHRRAHRPND